MSNSFANALTACKDGVVEAVAKAFLNQKLQKFGAVTRLEIDSKRKTMAAELALKGEATPLLINVDSYEVLQKAGDAYIVVRSVRASREWIGAVVTEFVVGREIKIPNAVGMAL
jgi:hypothetical protein